MYCVVIPSHLLVACGLLLRVKGAEMVTPRAEVKGTETRVSVTSPPPQEKNSALQRPKQPKTPQPPAEDKAAEQVRPLS